MLASLSLCGMAPEVTKRYLAELCEFGEYIDFNEGSLLYYIHDRPIAKVLK